MVAATSKLVPRHIAITMDGNGRWAVARGLTRSAGHRAGLTPVRMCIEECARRGVEALTLFAFSSENWGRPAEEVGSLMGLFLEALDREIAELHAKGVRVRFVGERRNLSVRLQARIAAAEILRPGTDFRLMLNMFDVSVAVKAQVKYLVNNLAMGVEFQEIRQGDRPLLAYVLNQLRKPRTEDFADLEVITEHLAAVAG